MKKFLIAFTFVFALPMLACAQMTAPDQLPDGLYKLDQTHASVTWKVSHLGLSNYTARFTKIDADLFFDPRDPTKSKLTASVDPTSIRTDYPNASEKDFDKKLAQDETWFNATKFPDIRFSSTRIEKTGEKTGKIYGDLTFLGVTKPLVLDVTFNGSYLKKPFADTPALGFSAKSVLKRSEWGFNTYVPMIGDDVELLIEVEFNKS
jgi:polyisoprenoid-binding protein YceI